MRRLVESVYVGLVVYCHVRTLLFSCLCLGDLWLCLLGARTVAEKESWNFLSILLPKSFDFCLELCYDICVKRKEIPSCGLMGEDSMREKIDARLTV